MNHDFLGRPAHRRTLARRSILFAAILVAGWFALPIDAQVVTDSRGRTALTKTDAVLLEAHKALFSIKIKTEEPGVFVKSVAFFVASDGLAVTQFSPLRGAIGATATIPGETNPVPVELVAAEPDVDLALIRIKAESLNPPRAMKFLAVADEAPDNGDPLWVLSINRYNRPAVDAGTFEAIISHASLPDDLRAALPTSHFSHWIQTGIKVSLENSGGPVINGKGQILGIATYVWQSTTSTGGPPTRTVSRGGSSSSRSRTGAVGGSKGLGLSAAHIARIISERPTEPLGFDEARKRYATMPTIFTRLPRLETTPSSLTNLRNSANTFATASICPLCKGEGVLEVEKIRNNDPGRSDRNATTQGSGSNRVADSNQNQRTNQTSEEDEPETKLCTRCKGNGFSNAEQVLKLGANIVEALARTDMTNRDSQAGVVYLNIKLNDVLKKNPQRFIEQLNNQARIHLHPLAMRVGTPVIFLGTLDSRATMPGKHGQLRSATLGDTGPTVFVAEPDLADANPRDIVLIGGILAGYMTNETGEPVPVLQRGFVVGIPEPEETDENGRPVATGSRSGGSSSSSSSNSGINSSDPRERFRAFMEARQRMERGRR